MKNNKSEVLIKDRVGVYCKVFGLSKNNDTGEKGYAGLAMELFEDFSNDPERSCKLLFDRFNKVEGKQAILEQTFLNQRYTADDVTIITKEEYYNEYSSEESSS